jgi:ABC-type polysaccharide/polyol phosphate transport system ATPase subunit
MPIAIRAEHLSKRFYLRHNRAWSVKERFLSLFHRSRREQAEEFWAVRDLSLEIERGEAVGIIGSNGSGKSTFLKLVAGIHRPTSGRVLLAANTRIGSMIELGLGFHPELTGRENLLLSASVHGLSRDRIDAIFEPVVAYSGLGQFIDEPLKSYSSGMHMRLGFAIAVHLEPDLLLLDEIFAVGDADFQKRCIDTIRTFQEQEKTILFVSHTEGAVKAVCGRACLLDHGQLRYEGSVAGAFAAYESARSGVPFDEAAESSASPAVPPAITDALKTDWLRQQGLRPEHRVLEIGCRDAKRSVSLIEFLERGGYVGLDADASAIERGLDVVLPAAGLHRDRAALIATNEFEHQGLAPFDVVIARDALKRLSLNAVARCLVSVMRQLTPDGRFFANFWEQPSGEQFAPAVRAGGLITSLDMPPHQYSFEMLRNVADAAGAVAERASAPASLDTVSVVVFRRKKEA